MKLSEEALDIISYACYPAHIQAMEEFVAQLEAEIAIKADYIKQLELKEKRSWSRTRKHDAREGTTPRGY